ncbi:conserved Plasmodium protein, unknown function [Plasmodium gaboni]|uniref:CLASP N-terminal domain-containing protein n=1 Tax=Plasmodium gaboni TaxID=647221 RepID=A0ABY1UU88_9APIC|nr:conserved Plasmodium protein, unknown function [Plasmodium gaboni]
MPTIGQNKYRANTSAYLDDSRSFKRKSIDEQEDYNIVDDFLYLNKENKNISNDEHQNLYIKEELGLAHTSAMGINIINKCITDDKKFNESYNIQNYEQHVDENDYKLESPLNEIQKYQLTLLRKSNPSYPKPSKSEDNNSNVNKDCRKKSHEEEEKYNMNLSTKNNVKEIRYIQGIKQKGDVKSDKDFKNMMDLKNYKDLQMHKVKANYINVADNKKITVNKNIPINNNIPNNYNMSINKNLPMHKNILTYKENNITKDQVLINPRRNDQILYNKNDLSNIKGVYEEKIGKSKYVKTNNSSVASSKLMNDYRQEGMVEIRLKDKKYDERLISDGYEKKKMYYIKHNDKKDRKENEEQPTIKDNKIYKYGDRIIYSDKDKKENIIKLNDKYLNDMNVKKGNYYKSEESMYDNYVIVTNNSNIYNKKKENNNNNNNDNNENYDNDYNDNNNNDYKDNNNNDYYVRSGNKNIMIDDKLKMGPNIVNDKYKLYKRADYEENRKKKNNEEMRDAQIVENVNEHGIYENVKNLKNDEVDENYNNFSSHRYDKGKYVIENDKENTKNNINKGSRNCNDNKYKGIHKINDNNNNNNNNNYGGNNVYNDSYNNSYNNSYNDYYDDYHKREGPNNKHQINKFNRKEETTIINVCSEKKAYEEGTKNKNMTHKYDEQDEDNKCVKNVNKKKYCSNINVQGKNGSEKVGGYRSSNNNNNNNNNSVSNKNLNISRKSLNVSSKIKNDKSITYISFDEITNFDFEMNNDYMNDIISELLGITKDHEWTKQIDNLINLRRILKFHHKLFFENHSKELRKISRCIIELLNSPRSSVSKNSLLCLSEFYSIGKKKMDNTLDDVILPCLKKAYQTSIDFLSSAANNTLLSICNSCSESKLILHFIKIMTSKQKTYNLICLKCLIAVIIKFEDNIIKFKEINKLIEAILECTSVGSAEIKCTARVALVVLDNIYPIKKLCGKLYMTSEKIKKIENLTDRTSENEIDLVLGKIKFN